MSSLCQQGQEELHCELRALMGLKASPTWISRTPGLLVWTVGWGCDHIVVVWVPVGGVLAIQRITIEIPVCESLQWARVGTFL